MSDLIDQATRLALNGRVRYNPGLPITLGFRPSTLPQKYGNAMAFTLKGTNIYKEEKMRTAASLHVNSINASVKARILRGERGDTTDYSGIILLLHYTNDPDAWHSLFYKPGQLHEYSFLLSHFTGLPTRYAAPFVSGSVALFGDGADRDNPRHVEAVLRSLLPAYQ